MESQDILSGVRWQTCFCGLLVIIQICQTKDATVIFEDNGATAVLRPDPVTDWIRRVVWSCEGILVAVWFENQTICSKQLEGRCRINSETGALTIKYLTPADCGIYKGKIYNEIWEMTFFNRTLKDCGNNTMKFNGTEMKNGTAVVVKWSHTDIVVIVLFIITVILIAVGGKLLVCCSKCRRQHPRGSIRQRSLACCTKRRMSSFQEVSASSSADPKPEEEIQLKVL